MSDKIELSDLLRDRSLLKQDVYDRTFQTFSNFKKVIEKELSRLRDVIPDERVRLRYDENGDFEAHAYVGSDVLVFNMHTNVFSFPKENAVWKSSYVEKDKSRAYCGVINVYNFLADSFLQSRMNDAGYLIGRIFVNKENHFIVEGKGQLGFLFRDFMNKELDKEQLCKILKAAIRYAVEFDLLMPPYDAVNVVDVMHIKAQSNAQQMKTGKRLGFKFESEE
ncbi:MAG: hypothetical protein WED10_05480 [Brumimicrobium sp.]